MPDEEEEDQYQEEAGFIPVSDIPNFEDAPTPAPTPLVRPAAVLESPAPTPLVPTTVGIGESGAPTPFQAEIGEVDTTGQVIPGSKRPVPWDHTPVDDETASQYFTELKNTVAGKDPLREEMLIRELTKYASVLPDRQKAKTQQYLSDVFTDEEALKKFADTPLMRERERFSAMPNLERYKAANWLWIEHVTGQKIDDEITYKAKRDEISGRLDGKPQGSDSDFFNSRKKEFEVGKESDQARIEVIGKGFSKAIADMATGNPVEIAPVLDEVKRKYPDAFKGKNAEQQADLLRGASDFVAQKMEEFGPQLAVAKPIIDRMIAGTGTPEDGIAFAQLIAQAGKKDAQQIIGLATLALNSERDELKGKKDSHVQAVENIKKAIFQGFGWVPSGSITQQEDQVEDALAALQSGQVRMRDDGQIEYPQAPLVMGAAAPVTLGRPLTEEETAAEREKLVSAQGVLGAQRIINDAMTKKLDPIQYLGKDGTFWGTVERGALAAVESAPMMVTSAVAGVLGGLVGGPVGAVIASDAVMFYITKEQEFQDLTINNPELDRGARKSLANWSSIAQLPFNHFELSVFTGKFPLLGKIFKDIKGGYLVPAMGKLIGAQGLEFTAETIQNGISTLTQEIASQAKLDLPKAMGKVWDQAVAQGPTVFFATLPYTLIGTGMASIREYGPYKKQLMARESLASAGFLPDDIDKIMAQPSDVLRDEAIRQGVMNRTPESVKAAGEKYGKDLADATAAMEKWATLPDMPVFLSRKLDDGTIEYVVQTSDGRAITTTTSLEQAKLSFEEQVKKAADEQYAAEEERAASDEALEETARAEQAWAMLPPEHRTSAKNALKFTPVEAVTPSQQAKLQTIQAAVSADGRTQRVVLVDVVAPTAQHEAGAVNFINWFESTFKKSVQFVASEDGGPLSFAGMVVHSDPNTIYLNASGNRNLLSLLGHEWSHTLEQTHPELWGEVSERMKPFVVDWAKEMGWISQTYPADQATPEFVANVIGDAFGDPDFWARLKAKDATLFERLVQHIQEWFDTVIDHASEWGTQSPKIISDLQGMRDLIMEAMQRAQTPEATRATEPAVTPTEPATPATEMPVVPTHDLLRVATQRTVTVSVFDEDLNGFTTSELVATPELLKGLQDEAKVYEKLINCLG